MIVSLNNIYTLNLLSYALFGIMIWCSISMFYFHFKITRFRIYAGWYIFSLLMSIALLLLNIGYRTFNNTYISNIVVNIATVNVSILWIIHLLIEILLSDVNNGMLYTLISIHIGIIVLNSHRVYIIK